MFPWTLIGVRLVGELVKTSRESKGWSQMDLRDELIALPLPYKYRASDTTIGKLEFGKVIPKRNLLVAISALRFVKDAEGKILEWDELSATAQEYRTINGTYKLPPDVIPTLRVLIITEWKNSNPVLYIEALNDIAVRSFIAVDRLQQIIEQNLSVAALNQEELTALASCLTSTGQWTAADLLSKLY